MYHQYWISLWFTRYCKTRKRMGQEHHIPVNEHLNKDECTSHHSRISTNCLKSCDRDFFFQGSPWVCMFVEPKHFIWDPHRISLISAMCLRNHFKKNKSKTKKIKSHVTMKVPRRLTFHTCTKFWYGRIRINVIPLFLICKSLCYIYRTETSLSHAKRNADHVQFFTRSPGALLKFYLNAGHTNENHAKYNWWPTHLIIALIPGSFVCVYLQIFIFRFINRKACVVKIRYF